MLEPQFRAKHLTQIRNAIFHMTFAIFPQIRHRVAGPLLLDEKAAEV